MIGKFEIYCYADLANPDGQPFGCWSLAKWLGESPACEARLWRGIVAIESTYWWSWGIYVAGSFSGAGAPARPGAGAYWVSEHDGTPSSVVICHRSNPDPVGWTEQVTLKGW